jgi:hypothetical protein
MADNSQSTTKTFTVTAEAASTIGGTRKRRKRTTAKTETMKIGKQEGGTSPGTTLQIEANKVTSLVDPPSTNFQKSTDVALAKTTTESSPAPIQSAGAKTSISQTQKPVKVILEKKKKTTRVLLSPTKVKKLNPTPTAVSAPKTRKVAKKIRMSLGGLGKRVNRANTIRNDAKKQKIEDVKKLLVEAKLIKAESKAPEGVLRTMYADYMTLKNRAL